MKYLIAVDLEGVNFVVGEPYKPLHEGSEQYKIAVKEATKELNVIASALYDSGAEQVYVWDNHGSGHNLNYEFVDKRIKDVGLDRCAIERMNVADPLGIDAIIFLGYHSKEGTLGGVLAHSYSSECIQYYKIDGKQVGEFYIDSNIALSKNIPVIMMVCDDVCIKEISSISSDIVSVITKHATGRNSALFRGDELYTELYYSTQQAVSKLGKMRYSTIKFPVDFEVRFTRIERAISQKESIKNKYGIDSEFGEDGHVLKLTANRIEDIKAFL